MSFRQTLKVSTLMQHGDFRATNDPNEIRRLLRMYAPAAQGVKTLFLLTGRGGYHDAVYAALTSRPDRDTLTYRLVPYPAVL
jgi:hypothetical protein